MRKYTDNDFKKAVQDNTSIRQVLISLGLEPKGGNYAVAKRRIRLLGLDISHFTGKGHLKGKTHNWAKKTDLKDILKEKSNYGGGTHKIKLRLFKEGIFEEKCYECGLTQWQGRKISFELEHKNGIPNDNRLDNLTILCPNCHSQTQTYRGRNKCSGDGKADVPDLKSDG